MALLLNDADVRDAVDPLALVESIEAALKAEAVGNATVPARMNFESGDAWLRVMPALVPSAGVMGLKVFHGVVPGGVRYMISLYSMVSGDLLALMDAAYLTAARTAATTAIAAKYLCPPRKLRLGVLGSGLEAQLHCEVLCAVGEVTEAQVYSPNADRRRSFAERMQQALGVHFTAVNHPRSSLDGADHVVVATNTGPSMSVACEASWLAGGQHVSSIGSTNVRLRELDTDVFRRADVIVLDTDPAQMADESGDIIRYYAEGGTLADARLLSGLVNGTATGRSGAEQLTLFKSVGSGLQDVAAAEVVYRRALTLGLGVEVTDLCVEKLPSSSRDAVPSFDAER